MRPRISQKEAAYLVTVLSSQLEELRLKLSNLEQLEQDLAHVIYDLKHPVQREYDGKAFLLGPVG